MAATTAGAVKAKIEGGGLGLSVYRDAAPSNADVQGAREPSVTLPYVTVREGISTVPNADGDLGDAAASFTVAELVQVDLWQQWRTTEGKVAESYTLPAALLKLLRGARLVAVGTSTVYGVTVASCVRLLEEKDNIVHHAITCTVHRAA